MAETSQRSLTGRRRRAVAEPEEDEPPAPAGVAQAYERGWTALEAVAAHLAGGTDLPVFFGDLTRTIAELVGSERCVFGLLDNEGGLWIQRDTFGFDARGISHLRLSCPPRGEGFASRVAHQGMVLRASAAETPLGSDPPDMLVMFPARDILAVPWRGGEERLGLLAVFDSIRPEGFTDEDVWILRLIAAAAGLVWRQRMAEDELRQARALAASAGAVKDEFLARMSHELRTPLVAVLGFAEILQLANLPAQYQEAADTILRAGSRLLGMVEDLLEVSRLETDSVPVSIEPVEVSLLLSDIVELLHPLASDRDVGLGFDPTATGSRYVLADRVSVKQALVSVLAHVIKLCEPGTHVLITITERADRQLRISITASGPGMSEADQSRLFDPFESLRAKAAGDESPGSGLALPRRLIQAMGGSIGVSSVIGSGTILWVTLPQGGESQRSGRRFRR